LGIARSGSVLIWKPTTNLLQYGNSRLQEVFMSIIRNVTKVLMSIIRCIGCGFVGALVAGAVAFSVNFLYFLVENDVSLDIIGIGLCGIWFGFAVGVLYGAIRTLTSLKRSTVLIAMSVLWAAVILMLSLWQAYYAYYADHGHIVH
jgi:hypothetical protein